MSNVKKLMMTAASGGDTIDVEDVFASTMYFGHNSDTFVDPRFPPDLSEGTHNTTNPKYYYWSATYSPEGDKCFIGGRAGNSEIHEYTLTRPFDIGSGYKTATFDFSSQVANCECVKFSTDGTTMYIGSYVNDAIYQYSLSTGYDISTASYASKSLDLTVQDSQTNMRAFDFKPDGTKIFIFEVGRRHVREYELTTAWDISTASGTTTSSSFSSGMQGGCFSADGTMVYMNKDNQIQAHYCSTPFNAPSIQTSVTAGLVIKQDKLSPNQTPTTLTGDLGLTRAGNHLFYCFIDDYANKIGTLYLSDPDDLTTAAKQFVHTDVDLETDGGLLWIKQFDSGNSHCLFDSERDSFNKQLSTNTTSAEATETGAISGVTTHGFGLGTHTPISTSGRFKAFSFKKQAKFFDIVTYTGTGSPMTISHNLGCTVGSMIIKCRDTVSTNWMVYHRGMGANKFMYLNSPNAPITNTGVWQNTTPTSSQFYVGSGDALSGSGKEYVAYLFAHNDGDGIFGENNNQDIIKCGSYTGTGSSGFQDGPDVDLGFEPEFLMIKNITDGTEWVMTDQKRGEMSAYQLYYLTPRDSQARTGSTSLIINLMPNGFNLNTGSSTLNGQNHQYVYWAIRKGPLKTPVHGMQVYANHWYGRDYRQVYGPWMGDLALISYKSTNSNQGELRPKLLKSRLRTNTNGGEQVDGTNAWIDFNDGYGDASVVSDSYMGYMFRQAPGFLDEVLYEGNGQSTQAIDHNLGSVPKMIWVKDKAGAEEWRVYISERAGTGYSMRLDINAGEQALADFPSNPTDTQFTVGSNSRVNGNGNAYYAALWGEIDGVTKFGTYTGDGDVTTTHTINAGLNSPPRWVMIKEIGISGSGAGSWWVFDSVLGLDGSGTARAWRMDLTNGWITSQALSGAVTATSNGFTVSNTSYDELNENNKTYFYWAIT
jgi:hypothetical protein